MGDLKDDELGKGKPKMEERPTVADPNQRLINSTAITLVPMRGALSRHRRVDDDDPDWPELPGEWEPQPVLPSAPDLAFQIRDIRASSWGCLPVGDAESVRDAIEEQLEDRFPQADLRVACLDDVDGKGATTIAVWTTPSLSTRVDQARDLGLMNVGILKSNESIGAFVNASFIRRTIQEQWDDLPKRYAGSGYPSPGGPIHLTGWGLKLEPDERIELVIDGYDERPWPDVSFKITYIDHVQVSSFAIFCETGEPEVDADVSWLNYVTTGFGAILSAAFWPSFFLFEDILEVAIHGGGKPPRQGGPGCAIVKGFFPDAVPIPGGQKLDIFYTRAPVTHGGMFAAGNYIPVAREAEAVIRGTHKLSVDFRVGTVTSNYSVVTSDMRGLRLIQWSGDAMFGPTNSSSTTARFSAPGPVGTILKREIRVHVEDQDGLFAEATLQIEIHVVDQLKEDVSPVCRAKPWLCEPHY